MQPTDIANLVSLSRPSLHPDGSVAVVAATRPVLDTDEYRSALWLVTVDGSAPPRRLTHGRKDSQPRFSPDGRWIAFLRAAPKGKPQLAVLPVAGGDARVLTDLPGGAGAPVWAPDSASIAFTARVPDAGRYGQDEKVPAGKEPPRRITGLQYRHDGDGFVVDQRSRLFVVDLDDGTGTVEARRLTEGDVDDHGVTWSPDGSRLAFVSARHEWREHDRCTDVCLIGRAGGEVTVVTDSTRWLDCPTFLPDGSAVLALGARPADGGDSWMGLDYGLFRIPLDGGEPQRLTDAERWHTAGEQIVVVGDRALVTAENRASVELVAVPLDGGEPTVVSAGRRVVTGFDVAGGTTVLTYAEPSSLGELGRLDGGEVVALTDFGAELAPSLVKVTDLEATAPDGQAVHGLLAMPAGEGPHPVLLMIHGGPFAQYTYGVLDEAQVYAGAGYAVVYGNPRGSSGYGQEYGRFIIGDVGERQAPDLLALLDAALQRPDLDASRVGVLGGSHGGYMTSWLIGHTDRFRAAISERAVNAVDSFEGASDIGWDFADNLYGRDVEQRRRQSPLTYADAITTPLLIIHSEEDWRCPIEQAQRLYVALRKRDAEVEMLIFPGEGHELSRSGLPSHRTARFDAILEWFGRHV